MKNLLKLHHHALHCLAGMLVFTAFMVLGLLLGLDTPESCTLGFYASALAALVKEFTDYLHGSYIDPIDILSTSALPLLISGIAWVI